jgi:hypothetical protein
MYMSINRKPQLNNFRTLINIPRLRLVLIDMINIFIHSASDSNFRVSSFFQKGPETESLKEASLPTQYVLVNKLLSLEVQEAVYDEQRIFFSLAQILTWRPTSDHHPKAMTNLTSFPAFGKQMRKEFLFADGYIPLNHGSYGTYPRSVHAAKLGWQQLAEQRPDYFIRKKYVHQLNKCRGIAAKAIKANLSDCVFVMNVTTGVNEILRSLKWHAGETVLCYSTVYGTDSS